MINYLQYIILVAGIWATGNGLLHDIAVLRQGRPFERELIRLLIDGHILIFAGIFYLISYKGIVNREQWAWVICLVTSLFLLGYCGLILKILPSIVTILINLVVLIALLSSLRNFQ